MDKAESRLAVKRQAELLSVNRSSAYREAAVPKSLDSEALRLMGLINRLHTDYPTWGYRTINSLLRREYGYVINRKKVRRMMRDMGTLGITKGGGIRDPILSPLRISSHCTSPSRRINNNRIPFHTTYTSNNLVPLS